MTQKTKTWINKFLLKKMSCPLLFSIDLIVNLECILRLFLLFQLLYFEHVFVCWLNIDEIWSVIKNRQIVLRVLRVDWRMLRLVKRMDRQVLRVSSRIIRVFRRVLRVATLCWFKSCFYESQWVVLFENSHIILSQIEIRCSNGK